MSDTLALETTDTTNGTDATALRAEVARLREALEGVLIILGDPEGYHEDDRTEVAQAVAAVERALGRRTPRQWRPLHPKSGG